MKQSTTRCAPNKAFTLVEVLVVVAIIGLAGAMVVPAILNPSDFSGQAATRMIVADILIAQNEAIASQSNRQVIFNTLLNSYRLADENGNTLVTAWKTNNAYAVNLSTDSNNSFNGVTIQNVNFGGTDPLILEFDPLGSPINGGSLNVVAPRVNLLVTVAPFTGRVTIQ